MFEGIKARLADWHFWAMIVAFAAGVFVPVMREEAELGAGVWEFIPFFISALLGMKLPESKSIVNPLPKELPVKE